MKQQIIDAVVEDKDPVSMVDFFRQRLADRTEAMLGEDRSHAKEFLEAGKLPKAFWKAVGLMK